MSDTKVSLVEGNTTTLTPVCELLDPGLKQGPRPCDWDPDITLHGADEWSEYGVIDGWMWATDRATALIQKSEKYEDVDSRADMGRQVISMCTRDFPAPLYTVQMRDVLCIGGIGELPVLGLFDLDRFADAVMWAAGDDGRVVLAIDEPKQGRVVRIAGANGRIAVVVGMKPVAGTEDHWRPTIDLPLAMVTP